MSENEGAYDITPPEDQPPQKPPAPKPGDPDFVPPVPIIEKADPPPEPSADESLDFDPDLDPDIKQNKGIAILAYVFFLIPLLVAPNSKFARFHANQGLLVFILWWVAIIGNIVLYFVQLLTNALFKNIMALSAFFSCGIYLIQPALLVGALALTVYGIIQAANGEKKPLPIFGQITLIK